MTDRERWIIYPLLLLALGAALRDKVVPQDTIECRTLVAQSIQTGALQTAGVQVRDPDGKSRIDLGIRQGWATPEKKKVISAPFIRLMDEQRVPRLVINDGKLLGTEIEAETIRAIDDRRRPRVVIGTQTFKTPVEAEQAADPNEPAEGEPAEPKMTEIREGIVQVLDEYGNPRVALDTIPSRVTQGEQSLNVSHGQVRVFGVANQPVTIINSEMRINDLWATRLNIRGARDKPAMVLVARPIVDAEGKPTGRATGHFVLNGAQGNPIVVMSSVGSHSDGAVEVLSGQSQKRVSLRGDTTGGGKVSTHHSSRDFGITLGHYNNFSGVLAQSANKPLPYSRLVPAQQIKELPERAPLGQQKPAAKAAADSETNTAEAALAEKSEPVEETSENDEDTAPTEAAPE